MGISSNTYNSGGSRKVESEDLRLLACLQPSSLLHTLDCFLKVDHNRCDIVAIIALVCPPSNSGLCKQQETRQWVAVRQEF
eukprot:1595956-Pleurochrysis_carterae.AAC.1